MPAMMDVIFSMILGFAIILIIVNANVVVSENAFYYNGQVVVQEMLISAATLIEGEFRNMGYGVQQGQTGSTGIIDAADDITITFNTKIGGVVRSIKYYSGDPGEFDFQNEMIRGLYRQVDNQEPRMIGYVTRFELRYFERNGTELSVPMNSPGNIHMVEIEMEVQHPHALYTDVARIDEQDPDLYYSTTMWRQSRLSSKNFSTR